MKAEAAKQAGDDRTRVVAYCDHWQNGGVESYLMNQFRHWDLTKMKLTLLTAEKTTDIYDAELKRLSVEHVVLLDKIYASPIRRILKNLSHCRRYFQQNPCDVAYFNLTNSVTMLYAGFAKWAGVPKRIVHSHCSSIQKGKTRQLKSIGHRLARQLFAGMATDWWACSDLAAKHLFPKKLQDSVVYIPNAINTQAFRFDPIARQKLREEWHLQNSLLVGTVGRCVVEKNQTFLLDVMANLRQQRPDARLLLVGDGPLLPELKQKAQQLGIQDVCLFYGFARAEEVPALLSAMDVFCLPSQLEGNPVSAIEAQANGLPCFLSDTITRQAKILPQTRYLKIENGAEKEWAEALNNTRSVVRTTGSTTTQNARFDIADCAPYVQKKLLLLQGMGQEER